MNFLEELENNKKQNNKVENKTPKELWESCFKYFKHFVSILQKDNDNFEMQFNFVFLNLSRTCLVSGPYEINRSQNDTELKFEFLFHTNLQKSIAIKRKDQRSAEVLQARLSKDGLLSKIKQKSTDEYTVKLNDRFPSQFQLILEDNKQFKITYKNVCTTTKRTIILKKSEINETSMDQIAKYLLGLNENLYKETISKDEITKIREQLKINAEIKAKREAELQAKLKEEQRVEEERIANTLKGKSKRYITEKSQQFKSNSASFIKSKTESIKSKLIEKINQMKQK
jgi:hypothetical protein